MNHTHTSHEKEDAHADQCAKQYHRDHHIICYGPMLHGLRGGRYWYMRWPHIADKNVLVRLNEDHTYTAHLVTQAPRQWIESWLTAFSAQANWFPEEDPPDLQHIFTKSDQELREFLLNFQKV